MPGEDLSAWWSFTLVDMAREKKGPEFRVLDICSQGESPYLKEWSGGGQQVRNTPHTP